MVLANKGIGQISEIIQQSTSEMSSIGGRIRELGKEYEAIGGEKEGAQALDFPQGDPPPVDPLEELKRKYQVSEDPNGALDWEPGWPLNMATHPMHVTATEARMLENLSPFELRDLNQTKEAAEVEAKVRFPPQNGANDTADNHTDAYRHAYWNVAWSNTIEWGEAGTTTKSTVPGQAPTPTGAGPGGFYDPGQPGGYGTSAGGY